MLILSFIGLITTVLFHFSLTKSNYDVRRRLARTLSMSNQEAQTLLARSGSSPPKIFFKDLRFYRIALLYIFARVFMNSALVFIPEWVSSRNSNEDSRNNHLWRLYKESSSAEYVATIPLASFVSSFIASIVSKQSNKFVGHKIVYFIGCLIGITGCVLIASDSSPAIWQLYLTSIIYGAGHSLLIIGSLSMIADFIGANSNSGGSIYSSVTLFDKLLTGVVIFVVSSM